MYKDVGKIEDLDLDDAFKHFLKTNTYLKWDSPEFWDNLLYILPHKYDKRMKKLPGNEIRPIPLQRNDTNRINTTVEKCEQNLNAESQNLLTERSAISV